MKEKNSLKPVPPTARGKKRYIQFRLISEKKLDEKIVSSALNRLFLEFFGELGVAERRLWFIGFSPASCKGTVRCSHTAVESVEAALMFLKEVKENKVIPVILRVSGSIKKLKPQLTRRAIFNATGSFHSQN
ncbi:MAG: hypothetical protein J4224_04745 [Candidatus Diapherotrites archaeon]|uniref:Ribonuclease P protein component 2 n=1 Tax=Candidatus Iainarchaeum sp. TaxID=3101447 RepID=A0A7J4IQY5_9ARCH|nr:MAG: ribonuclease P/MRP protein subunit POP5 [archaeon GW2011_AR10]MBS3059702.1 hypothetical protein [Candidatus Diapherotrites archaeon]HIH07842.1 hypothetical protein [Candidatus Diapherotrites archaeon]